MLLCYDDEAAWKAAGEAALQDAMTEAVQLAQTLHKNGQCPVAAPLQPTSMATSVRVREGKRVVTDGPFAETREHLGGFFLIEASNLDEAITIASKHPGARLGTVEVRPILEIPGIPR